MGWDRISGDLQAGQTVLARLARLMESQLWHLPSDSVVLLGEVSEKGQWPLPTFLSQRKLSPSSCLDARHFSSSLYVTGVLQAATQCWVRGSESE